MDIADILTREGVFTAVRATSKKQALQELARRAAGLTGIGERAIFDVLLERERLGTTGVGRGIAIPHGKLSDLDQIFGMFVILDQPIDFESVDNQPVDILFLLLAPESAGADHLKALARISRLLRDTDLCQKFRDSRDGDALYKLLATNPSSKSRAA
jgi:PTS system nitrogen regulatory IIA component